MRQLICFESPKRVFVFALLSVPFSVTVTALFAAGIGFAFNLDSIAPNSVEEFVKKGVGATRLLSALLFDPIVENFICLLWVAGLDGWKTKGWWAKPACIAAIAAFFHVLILWDARLFAVFPGFFVMTTLIANVKDRSVGYWASVLHHFCINAFTFSLAYWSGTNSGLKG